MGELIHNQGLLSQADADKKVRKHFKHNYHLGTISQIQYYGLYKDFTDLAFYAFVIGVTGNPLSINEYGVTVNANRAKGQIAAHPFNNLFLETLEMAEKIG